MSTHGFKNVIKDDMIKACFHLHTNLREKCCLQYMSHFHGSVRLLKCALKWPPGPFPPALLAFGVAGVQGLIMKVPYQP